MRVDPYRMMGWLIPGLCMAASGFLFYQQAVKLGDVQRQRDAAGQSLQDAIVREAEVQARVAEDRYAAADATDLEQTLFLSDLKDRVAQHGAVITNWTMRAAEYGDASQTDRSVASITPADPKDAELIKGITRVSSTLTLTGPYSAIRSFLSDIQNSERLFTLSDVNWTRTKEGTTLLVTISRYLSPPGNSSQAESTDNP